MLVATEKEARLLSGFQSVVTKSILSGSEMRCANYSKGNKRSNESIYLLRKMWYGGSLLHDSLQGGAQ